MSELLFLGESMRSASGIAKRREGDEKGERQLTFSLINVKPGKDSRLFGIVLYTCHRKLCSNRMSSLCDIY